jgi:hypothetical protein
VKKITSLPLLALFSCYSLLILSSCQKEPSVELPGKTNCQLVKTVYYDDNGLAADSIAYTYTNDLLTKGTHPDGYFTLEYANGKVSKRTFYETAFPGLSGYDVASYNAEGKLTAIKTYFDNNGVSFQYSQYDFVYTNGKLTGFDVKLHDFGTNQLETSSTSAFTYTGENISQCVTTDRFSSGVETYHYTYDNNASYLAKNNAVFTDYVFAGELEGVIIPLLLGVNNAITVTINSDETQVGYELDDKKNFHGLYFDGRLASRYHYHCK